VTRRQLTGVLAVALGLVVLLTPVGSALSSLALPSDEPPEAPVAGPPEPAPAIPALSASQQSSAQAALARDPQTRRFLAGRGYRVTEIGPWTTEQGTLIGASMLVGLSSPASFAMSRWPAVDYRAEPAAERPYRDSAIQMAASNVTELMVRVDLDRQAVVGIEPSGPGATIKPGPDVKRIPPETPGY
jgi:hypothetical protein